MSRCCQQMPFRSSLENLLGQVAKACMAFVKPDSLAHDVFVYSTMTTRAHRRVSSVLCLHFHKATQNQDCQFDDKDCKTGRLFWVETGQLGMCLMCLTCRFERADYRGWLFLDACRTSRDVPDVRRVQIRGHKIEEEILFRSSRDFGRSIWDMPAGAPTDGIEQVQFVRDSSPASLCDDLDWLFSFLPHDFLQAVLASSWDGWSSWGHWMQLCHVYGLLD